MGIKETNASIYRLKRFTSSTDKDFVAAIKIYIDNIDNNEVTSTNEITYCVDFYNTKFHDSDFTVVGLYLNKVLIGFAQFIYFKEEKLVFIDYLVIQKEFRKNNTFYEFIEKIKEYFDIMNYHPFFIVGEICLKEHIENSGTEQQPKTKNLVRLLKMNNFGVINIPYFQPMLGLNNYESNVHAILMLYPVDENPNIKKETFLLILKSIYFKHYERWYRIFLTEYNATQYSIHLNELFNNINQKLKNITSLQLEGYTDIEHDKKVSNPIRAPKKILYFILGFITLIALLGGISLILRFALGFNNSDQFYFMIIVAFIYLVILSMFSNKASIILNRLIEKMLERFS